MTFIRKNLVTILTGTAALIVITGCATTDLTALQQEPGYVAGFSDGCATATEAEKSFSTKRVRDDNAFAEDRAYQAGWRSGLLQCNHRYDDETSRDGRILGEDQNF